MIRHKARWLLAAALLWLAFWPAPVQSQSAALMEAYNQFSQLYAQGRYQEALPFAEKALRLGEEEFGPNDPTTAVFLNNLALLHEAQDHYAEAEPLYRRSLAIRGKAPGPEHPHVAQSLENYAALLRQTARADEAERMEARAKAIRAKSQ
jgi:tetratricopeptide (TPR) repeat protein